MPAGGEDPVIRAERAHLIRSREFLQLMRESVLAINPMAGDRVSLEYLKADLYRRAESLRDIPDAPLFFGRLDYDEEGSFHVGRRHVHDQDGTPVVIDWRAPVSRPFYRASQADPMGLVLRRRFGFARQSRRDKLVGGIMRDVGMVGHSTRHLDTRRQRTARILACARRPLPGNASKKRRINVQPR